MSFNLHGMGGVWVAGINRKGQISLCLPRSLTLHALYYSRAV